jgi:hypothetical protein
MHPFSVVKCHPVNDFIFGLPPSFEAHGVQAFDLQRAEQGLCDREFSKTDGNGEELTGASN